jgi:hypothetical protein
MLSGSVLLKQRSALNDSSPLTVKDSWRGAVKIVQMTNVCKSDRWVKGTD